MLPPLRKHGTVVFHNTLQRTTLQQADKHMPSFGTILKSVQDLWSSPIASRSSCISQRDGVLESDRPFNKSPRTWRNRCETKTYITLTNKKYIWHHILKSISFLILKDTPGLDAQFRSISTTPFPIQGGASSPQKHAFVVPATPYTADLLPRPGHAVNTTPYWNR